MRPVVRPLVGKEVLQAAAEVFGISVQDIISSVRIPLFVRARGLATYILRQQKLSYVDIAHTMHRDHTSIMAAHRRTAAAIAEGNEGLIADLSKILARLKGTPSIEGKQLDEEWWRKQLSMEIRVDALQREVLDLRAEVDELKRRRDGGVDP